MPVPAGPEGPVAPLGHAGIHGEQGGGQGGGHGRTHGGHGGRHGGGQGGGHTGGQHPHFDLDFLQWPIFSISRLKN